MAHIHFRRTVYKSGGVRGKSRVDYITRAPSQRLHAASQLRHVTSPEREDLVYTNSRNLPAWAEGNPQTYFRAAERYEWALGNAFEEWKVSLPQELSPRQNMDLMRDLVETIAGNRLPITYAFHSPLTLDGTHAQPHLHLLLSARQHDGISRTPTQHFTKYNRAHPERGGAPKDPALYHLRAVKQWRVTITDIMNLHLERAGCAGRVHPDRLDDRGIVRRTEPKLLPSESRNYRKKGVASPRLAEVLATRATRKETDHIEQADARAYWEERKGVLGIAGGTALPTQLAAVRAARALVRDQAPARRAGRGDGAVSTAEWDEAQAAWQALQGQAVAASGASLAHDLRALTRHVEALSPEEGRAGEVRIRLWDREHGMGH